jgi:hypothetical protein
VDHRWLKPGEAALARTRRFMIRLLASATILWLLMMSLVLILSI